VAAVGKMSFFLFNKSFTNEVTAGFCSLVSQFTTSVLMEETSNESVATFVASLVILSNGF